jgi:hypothetical protein
MSKTQNEKGVKEETPAQPIVQPMVDELTQQPPQTVDPPLGAPPRGPIHPPQPAELDQDAGSRYDPSHVFPQT